MVQFVKLTMCVTLFYGRHNRPSKQVIRETMDRCRTTHTLVDNTYSQRRHKVRTEEVTAAVRGT